MSDSWIASRITAVAIAGLASITIEAMLRIVTVSAARIRPARTVSSPPATGTGNGTIANTTNNRGAGIYNSGTMTINGCAITGNTTFTDGGGIYTARDGTAR